MDFLKDIVKEIGDDFTQLAADINEEVSNLLTQGLWFLTQLYQAAFLGAYLVARSLQLLENLVLAKTFFSLAVAKNFLGY